MMIMNGSRLVSATYTRLPRGTLAQGGGKETRVSTFLSKLAYGNLGPRIDHQLRFGAGGSSLPYWSSQTNVSYH
jgi:hypothetical protein